MLVLNATMKNFLKKDRNLQKMKPVFLIFQFEGSRTFRWYLWWWIVFTEWMPDERRLAIFSSRNHCLTIVNLRHAVSRIWACAELEFRVCWIQLCSSDNHYTTILLYLQTYSTSFFCKSQHGMHCHTANLW